MFDQLSQRLRHLTQRLLVYIRDDPFELMLELVAIWLVVYVIYRFLQGTRGAGAIKGLLVVIVPFTVLVELLGSEEAFIRLHYLYNAFLTFAAIALVIVFQPELRRALVRLGETRWLPGGVRKARVIEELLGAVAYLSKNKIGALVAIERQVGLKGIIEAGTRLDAQVSKDLLNTISVYMDLRNGSINMISDHDLLTRKFMIDQFNGLSNNNGKMLFLF